MRSWGNVEFLRRNRSFYPVAHCLLKHDWRARDNQTETEETRLARDNQMREDEGSIGMFTFLFLLVTHHKRHPYHTAGNNSTMRKRTHKRMTPYAPQLHPIDEDSSLCSSKLRCIEDAPISVRKLWNVRSVSICKLLCCCSSLLFHIFVFHNDSFPLSFLSLLFYR